VDFINLGNSHNLNKAINVANFVNHVNTSSTPTSHLTTLVALVNTNLILYKTLSKHVSKWCFNYKFSNLLIIPLLTILLSPLLANIDKLLSKFLILVSFFQHNLFVLYYTNSMFLQHISLQRKNNTQQKDKEKIYIALFPSKTPFEKKQQEFKSYTSCRNLN